MIYWDTSAIVPLYVNEPTSSYWESQLSRSGAPAKTSALAITEFNYALKHKTLRRNLSAEYGEALIAKFAEDCEVGHWELYPLGADIITASLHVADKCYASANPVPLRSLDGLHLGTALTLSCDTLATGDRRLANAAEKLNLKVLFMQ